jgi:hypothetical protein
MSRLCRVSRAILQPPVPLKNFLKDKETRATPGLFVTYSYRTKSYMLVQKQQLGKPLMLMGTVSQGGGQLVGGGPLGSQTSTNFLQAVLLLERHGNRLYLIEPPHSYLDQPAHHKAVKQTLFSDGDCLDSDRGRRSRRESFRRHARESG